MSAAVPKMLPWSTWYLPNSVRSASRAAGSGVMAAEVESPAILKVFVGAMSVMHRCPSAHSEAMWVWRQGANIRSECISVAHYRDIVFPAQVGYSAQLLRSEYAARWGCVDCRRAVPWPLPVCGLGRRSLSGSIPFRE